MTKEMSWSPELPERLIDKVSPGDRVLVHTKGGTRVVMVAAVDLYRPHEHTRALRMVVKKGLKGKVVFLHKCKSMRSFSG